MTSPYLIDPGWIALLADLKSRSANILRAASLPEDLFNRPRPTVAPDAFNRLFEALAQVIGPDTPGLILGQVVTAHTLHPPVFAAFCCEDPVAAFGRLSRYAPLAGPLKLEAHAMAGGLELTVESDPGIALLDEYIAAQLVFAVTLARQATRHAVRPIAVEMTRPPAHKGYADFFGTTVRPGPFNRVVFSPTDARRRFLPPGPELFASFDPELRLRLDQLPEQASCVDRVRSVLMEALPAGQPDVGTVARRLGPSARTLQRRLGAEGTGFQDVLQGLRDRLARHYLKTTGFSSADIAFLLGYDDPNSFTRAFHAWTGTTPETLRRKSV